jgi:hypothetical protein
VTVSPDPHAALRASDRDRDRVAETLAQAFAEGRLDADEYRERLDVVYGARTLGELETQTRDLPGHLPAAALAGPGALPVVPDPRPRTPVVDGPRSEPAVVALFSSTERSGHWTVPQRLVATAAFGEVVLDLSQAQLAAREVELVVNAILGSVRVVVPDDVRVSDAGVAILGTREVTGPATAPPPDGPLVRLSGVSLLGSVEVLRSGPSGHRPIGG